MIGFVAAESREFRGLRRHLSKERKLRLGLQWAVSGELNGDLVILAANGPGPLLARYAAQAIGEVGNLTALVSYGFCGALNPALSLNDIVLGGVLSIDRVVVTAAEKAELRASGADAIEMEAAGVAAYATEREIPLFYARVVTDTATEDLPFDFNLVRDAQGRFSRAKILAQAALSPRLFPRLIEFNHRVKAASNALGDFVAHHRF